YVLRRIMRRAMRHAHMIGATDPMIYKLVPSLVAQMGQAFPELGRAEALISETLKLEESRFKTTLDRGLKLLDDATADLGVDGVLDGETAFKLYDTYGFPLDLTQDALRNRQMTVDEDAFNVAMEHQRAEARAAWSGSGDAATEEVWFAVREELGATEFLGYETEAAEGLVTAIVVDGKRVDQATDGMDAAVIVNQTPFYAESGGQMGDCGIAKSSEATLSINDTQKKLGDLHVHMGKVTGGALKVGDTLSLTVDGDRRSDLRANHSATHLLHEALRRKLGDHVTQKGSLVAPDKLRFDISHPKAVEAAELSAAEAEVNALIRGNSDVSTRLMTPDEAIDAGAMALFGEKYGDEVRVVSMGEDDYSVELCGGTHVRRTGDIGLLKILSEGAVASGVRRIEALTGRGALAYLDSQEAALQATAALLKAPAADVADRVQALLDERKALERDLTEARKKLAAAGGTGGGASVDAGKDIGGIAFSPRLLDGMPAKDLKGLADEIKGQIGSGVVALVSVNDGKVSLVVGVTEDLTDKIDAVELVRIGSATVGGKGGGGRPDMAQAGGPDVNKAQQALDAIEKALSG
ncbi:MAG: alanine--tRNA ligase, partial [Alphaproteobacteria bacterium]